MRPGKRCLRPGPQPRFTVQALRRQVPQSHRFPVPDAVLDDGVLALHDVDDLRVMALDGASPDQWTTSPVSS